MSTGGSAMTRGNQLSSNKGLAVVEVEFTQRNEPTDAPRNDPPRDKNGNWNDEGNDRRWNSKGRCYERSTRF